jgi:hypothetical protein
MERLLEETIATDLAALRAEPDKALPDVAMSVQLSLPGLDATAPPFRPDAIRADGGKPLKYTLFLAIFPRPEDAYRIAQAAADLRSQHGLAGTQLSSGRLHITLHAIAAFIDTIPQAAVDAAIAAASRVVCPPLPVVFERASP